MSSLKEKAFEITSDASQLGTDRFVLIDGEKFPVSTYTVAVRLEDAEAEVEAARQSNLAEILPADLTHQDCVVMLRSGMAVLDGEINRLRQQQPPPLPPEIAGLVERAKDQRESPWADRRRAPTDLLLRELADALEASERELTFRRALSRTYPADMSVCSQHQSKEPTCETCYPDLWALCGEHVDMSRKIVKERDILARGLQAAFRIAWQTMDNLLPDDSLGWITADVSEADDVAAITAALPLIEESK